jgi:hypothetical protein
MDYTGINLKRPASSGLITAGPTGLSVSLSVCRSVSYGGQNGEQLKIFKLSLILPIERAAWLVWQQHCDCLNCHYYYYYYYIKPFVQSNTKHIQSLIHSWRHVSALANMFSPILNMDMVRLVSVYIMGSHIVYKPLFVLNSCLKSIGRFNFKTCKPSGKLMLTFMSAYIYCGLI